MLICIPVMKTKQLGLQAEKRRLEHYKAHNITRTVADLKDPAKFGVGDAHEFARLLNSIKKDLTELEEVRVKHKKAIRELESAMLKGLSSADSQSNRGSNDSLAQWRRVKRRLSVLAKRETMPISPGC